MAKRISKQDKTAAQAVAAYATQWARIGLRASTPTLVTMPAIDGLGVGVVHIDRNGNHINGGDVRVRHAIAFFTDRDAALREIRGLQLAEAA